MSSTAFCLEKTHTARKKHHCNGCNTSIEPGERYLSITGKWPENDGIARFAYHPDCRATEHTLNVELLDYGEDYATLSELLSDNPHDIIPLLPDSVAARLSHRIDQLTKKYPTVCPPDILQIIQAARQNDIALTAMQVRIMQHITSSKEKITSEQIGQSLKLYRQIRQPIGRLIAKKLINRNKNGELSINQQGKKYIHAPHPAH